MARHFLALSLLAAAGCGGVPTSDNTVGQPLSADFSSPLPKGVYTGSTACDTTTIDAQGRVSVEAIPLSVTFEVNEQGIPIVQGREIAVGRTLTIGGLEVYYTRIESTLAGIVWHFDTFSRVDGASGSGFATSELRTTSSDALEYRFTQTFFESSGGSLNQVCTLLMFP